MKSAQYVLITAVIMFAAGFLSSWYMAKVKNHSSAGIPAATKSVRYGKIIKVKPEKLGYYKMLHANPWPEVLAALKDCNLRNFSIYYRDGYLFSYYEYIGDDYDKDMSILSEKTKNWLKETDPCQVPVESAGKGEWWSVMEEVFHSN